MGLKILTLRKFLWYCLSAVLLVGLYFKHDEIVRQVSSNDWTGDPTGMAIQQEIRERNTTFHSDVVSADETELCLDRFGNYTEYQVTVEVTRTPGDGVAAKLLVDNSVTYSWRSPDKNCTVLVLDDSLTLLSIRSFVVIKDSELLLKEFISGFPKGSILVMVHFKHRGIIDTIRTFSTYPKDKYIPDESTIAVISRFGYKRASVFDVLPRNRTVLQIERQCARGRVFQLNLDRVGYSDVLRHHDDLGVGGSWSPSECGPRSNIAIIIPFRDREEHLWMFLENIIAFLKLQQTSFTIFVINQAGSQLFNRASLMNVGYLEARKVADFDCYIFHDVDSVPENLANLYQCDEQPRHLASARNVTGYRYFTPTSDYPYFGGVIALTEGHIKKINGFSNKMFGWGGEDDEMFGRIKGANLTVLRPSPDIGSYTCFAHDKDSSNPHLHRRMVNLYRHGKRYWASDGLNTTDYDVLTLSQTGLYTNVSVVLPGPSDKDELLRWQKEQGQGSSLLRHVKKQQTIREIMDEWRRSRTLPAIGLAKRNRHNKG